MRPNFGFVDGHITTNAKLELGVLFMNNLTQGENQ
jgi:prepilin-type processing-associated H-X9-DG protein